MTNDLTLYSHPQSRGRIARWMLEETGAPYKVEYMGYGTTMKGTDYLAINPMGKVPALKHGNIVVTEVAAICAYLADAFPQANLAPPNDQRGAYYRWLFFGAGPVEAAITNKALGVQVSDEQRGFVGYGSLEQVLDTLERAVSGGGYIASDTFTAADLYIGAQIGYGLRFNTIEARPAFTAYWERLSKRPGRQRADELDNAAMEKMKG